MGNTIDGLMKHMGIISQNEQQDQAQISPQTQMGNLGGAGYMQAGQGMDSQQTMQANSSTDDFFKKIGAFQNAGNVARQ